MRIFITGITGTIGSMLHKKLTKAGHTVGGLTRQEKKLSEFENCYLGDITRIEHIKNAFNDFNPELIIHAAAFKHVEKGEEYLAHFHETNVQGSVNILKAMVGKRCRAVLLSTDKAVFPINFYGYTKAIAEKFFLKSGQSVIRYGNVLGSSGSFIPILIDKLRSNTIIPVTDIEMTRFWIKQDAIADYIIETALDIDKEGLNIPTGLIKSASLMDIISTLSNLMGLKPVVDFVGMRSGEKLHEHLYHQYEEINQELSLKTVTSEDKEWRMGESEIRKLCNDLLNWI